MKKIICIGDVHGKIELLEKILEKYSTDEYFYYFLGDLNDYEFDIESKSSLKCILKVKELVDNELAECVQSNHLDKLYRWMKGRNVTLTHGLSNTANELNTIKDTIEFNDIKDWLSKRPLFVKFNIGDKKYVCAHAYFDDHLLALADSLTENSSKKHYNYLKNLCIRGPRDQDDDRIEWYYGGYDVEKRITQFHLIAGHYHIFVSGNNFTVVDTNRNDLVYYIPEDDILGSQI